MEPPPRTTSPHPAPDCLIYGVACPCGCGALVSLRFWLPVVKYGVVVVVRVAGEAVTCQIVEEPE